MRQVRNWWYARHHDPVDWAVLWPEFALPPEAHVAHVEAEAAPAKRSVSRYPRP